MPLTLATDNICLLFLVVLKFKILKRMCKCFLVVKHLYYLCKNISSYSFIIAVKENDTLLSFCCPLDFLCFVAYDCLNNYKP